MSYIMQCWQSFKGLVAQYLNKKYVCESNLPQKTQKTKKDKLKGQNITAKRKIKRRKNCYEFNPFDNSGESCSRILNSFILNQSVKKKEKKIKKVPKCSSGALRFPERE